MSDIAIRVENLSKLYHIGALQQRHDTLRDALTGMFRRGHRSTNSHSDELWALRDVSFEVKRGEVVGIIGRNGAGKSTLLKILSRITEPTSGRAEIHGRVGSLLEVGTGFHPELTGRENVYLNGAILGMHRHEIQRSFDEIVAFAEIERFLDTPVKRYSSGMYVRLAFAVAAHLEPEILLVDEVLAVGDAAFQKKCLGKMGDVAKAGRTVLFVSHNMAAVQAICVRAILVHAGHLESDGLPGAVIAKYSWQTQSGNGTFDLTSLPRSDASDFVQLECLRVGDASNITSSSIPMGGRMVFELDYSSSISLERASFQIGVYGSLMQPICLFNSALSGFSVDDKCTASRGTVRCLVPYVNLTAGRYFLNLAITDTATGKNFDHLTGAAHFDVVEADVFGTGKVPPSHTPCFFKANWELRT